MFIDFASFLIFIFVTTITPGPNNISSLSFCLKQGYTKTLPYMLGIISGVYCVLTIVATALYFFNSTSISDAFYWLKFVGAAYILYLAYKTFQMNVNWQSGSNIKSHFLDGLLLQSVNPKSYFFAMTVYTTFINYQHVEYWQLLLLNALLVSNTFAAVSIWGAVGTLLKQLLQRPLFIRIFGAIMSLGLIYTAYRIIC